MTINRFVALTVCATLTACGGGGSTSSSSPIVQIPTTTTPPTTPTPPPPPPTYKTVTLPSIHLPWFYGTVTNKDSSESLLLTTIDGQNYNRFTPPTPAYVLEPNADGSVSDKTSTYFSSIPSFYWARNVVTFTHPQTKTQAVWFCNQGREEGDVNLAATPRLNGRWAERDALYVMDASGTFRDASSTLPDSIDFSHGCSVAYAEDGSALLVKNTLGVFSNFPSQQILKFDGSKWANDAAFDNTILRVLGAYSPFWTGAGFIENRRNSSFVFGAAVVSRLANGYSVKSVLSAPDLEARGYKIYHGGAVGDITGDGFDDIAVVLSADGVIKSPFLAAARIVIFKNDGRGNFVYDATAIKDVYGDTDFGITIRIFDINFDGKLDIVTDGTRYEYGTSEGPNPTTKVLLNDGSGNFQVKTIIGQTLNSRCTFKCQLATYFLRGATSSSYNLMTYSSSSEGSTFYSQLVTAEKPLDLR